MTQNVYAMRAAIPQGTLDMLILQTLAGEQELHGFEIAESIRRSSADVLHVEEGSLYPALQRLEQRGLITSDWGVTENGRRARYYEITAAGRRSLGEETVSWRKFAEAVEVVLQAT